MAGLAPSAVIHASALIPEHYASTNRTSPFKGSGFRVGSTAGGTIGWHATSMIPPMPPPGTKFTKNARGRRRDPALNEHVCTFYNPPSPKSTSFDVSAWLKVFTRPRLHRRAFNARAVSSIMEYNSPSYSYP